MVFVVQMASWDTDENSEPSITGAKYQLACWDCIQATERCIRGGIIQYTFTTVLRMCRTNQPMNASTDATHDLYTLKGHVCELQLAGQKCHVGNKAGWLFVSYGYGQVS